MDSFIEIIKNSFTRTAHTIKYFPLIFASMIVMKLSLNMSNNILFRLSVSKEISNVVIAVLVTFLLSILLNMLSISVHTRDNYQIEPITIPKLMLKVAFNGGILLLLYFLLKKYEGAVIALLLIFNPLVETLYMIDEEFYKSIWTSLKFNFKNFLTWNIPNVMIFAILYNLIMKNYTFEDFIMSNEVVSILKFGLLLMFISLFMLYRANLYRILETGEK
ncbi:MAG: hypothetical protein E7K75_01430 [Finegoldia magna]|uniref:Uncharacterized protein n=1 Tax=Finegoldia magna ATCC 53516 TaxID=525282 RepID=D6SAY5_FINMA|nr:hypothetical protein [Finegoldia magna]EFH92635.1 hypothetical protein HMPREF0391_11607 [Finegoldia magna ATCC 53516]MBS5775961.1 hypothetical protein [Finegoldia magna]MDU1010349.1 hypothetical protein [Finegoldia magna]MDU1086994.1 hypothetical protein [Finegoldia magna]MDU1579270.1 hypothetical protein [Finegoldia magna]